MEEEDARVHTFFYQGNRQARYQGALYGEKIGVRLPDGQQRWAIHPAAPRLLHNMHTYSEIPEIEHDAHGWNPLRWAQSLSNKIGYSALLGIDVPSGWHVNHGKLTIGGDVDVAHHAHHIRQLIRDTPPDTAIVAAGTSRGAATTLVSVSELRADEQARIKLVVLEGCFDSIQGIISLFPCWFQPLQRSFLWLLSRFAAYDYAQTTPEAACVRFPHTIPVVFVASKADGLIPPALVQALVNRLRALGHPDVRYLELDHSPHYNMPNGHPDDRAKYERFMAETYASIPELAHLAEKTCPGYTNTVLC